MTQTRTLLEGAKMLLRQERFAVLSTHCVEHPGYPFGSLVPYALSARGEPLMFISALAEHTRNLVDNPRCCLTVLAEQHTRGDRQAHGRLTLLGHAGRVDGDAHEDAAARLRARHQGAEMALKLPDFALYSLALDHVRWVAGFGQMGWLGAHEFIQDPSLKEIAGPILLHMNADHQEALRDLLLGRAGVEAHNPVLVGVDAWGMDIREQEGGTLHRIEFHECVHDAHGVRRAILDVLKDVREA